MKALHVTPWLLAAALTYPPAPARAADGDRYLPGDTQAVVTLRVKQILESPLLKKDQAKIQAAMQGAGEVQTVLNDLGFDPLKDLDSVTMGGAGAADPEKGLAVVRGKFDLAKFKARAEQAVRDNPDALKVHQVGGHSVYEAHLPGQPRAMFVGLLDGNTLVAGARKEAVVEAFDVKAGKKQPGLKKDMQDLLAKADAKQSISVAALGSALGGEVPFGDKIVNIRGGIALGDDLQADFAILTKDAGSAKELAQFLKDSLDQGKNILQFMAMTQKELAPLTELVDTLKVSETGSTVNLKGQVTKEALEKLKKDR